MPTDAEIEASAIEQLHVTSDFLDAIDRLRQRYDMVRILDTVKTWVAYMDRIIEIQEPAQSDGDEGGA